MGKAFRLSLVSILALTLLLSLGGLAMADNNLVKIQDGAMGKYLVDAKGMTLYWFNKDKAGQSACAGDCLVKWPAYHREKVEAGPGLKASDFGTITRADGAKQTTFRGYPLYYFFQDKAAGETKGDKVAGVWFLVDPGNFPPK